MLFCEIHPICYEISLKKEICKRHIKDYLSDIKFAKTKSDKWLPNVVTGYSCNLIKRGKGVDLRLQENKAVNIRLACDKIDGLLIRPGEMFSFWHTVGKTTKKKRPLQFGKYDPLYGFTQSPAGYRIPSSFRRAGTGRRKKGAVQYGYFHQL